MLPSKAMAKVSCRLVADQTPAEIEKLMRAHIASVTPPGVTIAVQMLHGGQPWSAELEGPLYDAARRALTAAFGRDPVIIGEGGSIPVVSELQRVLGVPVLLLGLGLPGVNPPAPHERILAEDSATGMPPMASPWAAHAGAAAPAPPAN